MYREVTMLEVKEVLQLWREAVPTKRLAAQLGLDPKTVRRYLRAAIAAGVPGETGPVTDDGEVLLALQPAGGRPRGEGWAQCAEQREASRRWLADGLRFAKLLVRQGVAIAIRRSIALRCSSCSLARPLPRCPSSTATLGRSCKSTLGGSAGLRCRSGRSGAGFARGFSRRCGRVIASSSPPGRAILQALIAGETDALALTELARGGLRKKLGSLRAAVRGHMTDLHRFMLRRLLSDRVS